MEAAALRQAAACLQQASQGHPAPDKHSQAEDGSSAFFLPEEHEKNV